jgi:hypothetical protein
LGSLAPRLCNGISARFEDFAPFVRQARESALQAAALDSENPQAQYVLAQTSHWADGMRKDGLIKY